MESTKANVKITELKLRRLDLVAEFPDPMNPTRVRIEKEILKEIEKLQNESK